MIIAAAAAIYKQLYAPTLFSNSQQFSGNCLFYNRNFKLNEVIPVHKWFLSLNENESATLK